MTDLIRRPARAPNRSAGGERFAVSFAFAASGVTMGGWLARIPTTKARIGVTDAGWGSVAVFSAFGVVVAMLLTRRFIDRVGTRHLAIVALPLNVLVPAINGFATRPVALAFGLVLWGGVIGLQQVVINSQAVLVERRYGTVIMSSFHAWWSVGALTGGLLGVGAAQISLGVGPQLLGTGTLLIAAAAVVFRWLPRDTRVKGKPERVRFTRQLALIGAIAFLSQLCESSVALWTAVYAHESLRETAAVGAAAYVVFVVAQSVGRLLGNLVLRRFGHVRTVMVGTVAGAAGLATGLMTATYIGLLLGLVAFAWGLACVNPVVFSMAGRQPGITTGAAVSTIALAAWPASLLGPPLVGFVSQATTLRVALLMVAALTSVMAVAARRVNETPAGGIG